MKIEDMRDMGSVELFEWAASQNIAHLPQDVQDGIRQRGMELSKDIRAFASDVHAALGQDGA